MTHAAAHYEDKPTAAEALADLLYSKTGALLTDLIIRALEVDDARAKRDPMNKVSRPKPEEVLAAHLLDVLELETLEEIAQRVEDRG